MTDSLDAPTVNAFFHEGYSSRVRGEALRPSAASHETQPLIEGWEVAGLDLLGSRTCPSCLGHGRVEGSDQGATGSSLCSPCCGSGRLRRTRAAVVHARGERVVTERCQKPPQRSPAPDSAPLTLTQINAIRQQAYDGELPALSPVNHRDLTELCDTASLGVQAMDGLKLAQEQQRNAESQRQACVQFQEGYRTCVLLNGDGSKRRIAFPTEHWLDGWKVAADDLLAVRNVPSRIDEETRFVAFQNGWRCREESGGFPARGGVREAFEKHERARRFPQVPGQPHDAYGARMLLASGPAAVAPAVAPTFPPQSDDDDGALAAAMSVLVNEGSNVEQAHPEITKLCTALRSLGVPCDGFTPAADAICAIRAAQGKAAEAEKRLGAFQDKIARSTSVATSAAITFIPDMLKPDTPQTNAHWTDVEILSHEMRRFYGVVASAVDNAHDFGVNINSETDGERWSKTKRKEIITFVMENASRIFPAPGPHRSALTDHLKQQLGDYIRSLTTGKPEALDSIEGLCHVALEALKAAQADAHNGAQRLLKVIQPGPHQEGLAKHIADRHDGYAIDARLSVIEGLCATALAALKRTEEEIERLTEDDPEDGRSVCPDPALHVRIIEEEGAKAEVGDVGTVFLGTSHDEMAPALAALLKAGISFECVRWDGGHWIAEQDGR